ncbi:preprotein translocase subunit SecE [Bythopirellula polymerisocia]|uniref:Preprotein translocase subunit SecE n=1 Tax=Bythopirellula polymerisocia TaxID=2528003 RepID=A0A5C6D0C7_9BACT|nr:preprotein translocase subunit SecE [Bythopirellula polymerisocia]TWU30320.1 hypothetical protein Pla144_11060 [Bythopirellula polymerisocia]
MIRTSTFAILAVVTALELGLFIASPGGNPSVMHYACLLVARLGIFAVCDRGRFANYLGNVDEEAKQIAWPNDLQVRHNAKIVVFLMMVLVIASCCINTLINYLLDISR